MESKYCYIVEVNKNCLIFPLTWEYYVGETLIFRQVTVTGSQVIKYKGKGENALHTILVVLNIMRGRIREDTVNSLHIIKERTIV